VYAALLDGAAPCLEAKSIIFRDAHMLHDALVIVAQLVHQDWFA
jgi:hypothetical protein